MQALIDDNGSLGRLMQTRFDQLPPEARLIAYQNWMRAETAAQAVGSGTGLSDAVTFTAVATSMGEDAIKDWLESVAQCQRGGTC